MIEALPAGSATTLSVWIPARPSDTEAASRTQADAWIGPHVTHVWDGERQIANAFAATLKVTEPAWDVFLAYPRGARWDGDAPPAPATWMHQLPSSAGAPPALAFVPEKFAALVAALVAVPSPPPSPKLMPALPVPGRK